MVQGYFGKVYDMGTPDPKNKQNKYTFTGDCSVVVLGMVGLRLGKL